MVPPCLGSVPAAGSLAAGISLFPAAGGAPHCPSSFYIVSVDDAVGFRSHHRSNDPEADCRVGHRRGVGAVLGLLFGLCPKIEDVGTPLIHVLQAIPPVCWVVLALVWFGFNGKPCVFIVATATVPTVVINLSHGVRSVDPQLLEMARLYQFSRWKMLRHVTLPSIRPYFRSALEIVIGGGWKLAVMGEVLTTNSGIGGAITTARLNIEPDAIIAWSLLLVLGCYLTQRLLRMAFCGKEGVTC